jgi:hypothetical protein
LIAGDLLAEVKLFLSHFYLTKRRLSVFRIRLTERRLSVVRVELLTVKAVRAEGHFGVLGIFLSLLLFFSMNKIKRNLLQTENFQNLIVVLLDFGKIRFRKIGLSILTILIVLEILIPLIPLYLSHLLLFLINYKLPFSKLQLGLEHLDNLKGLLKLGRQLVDLLVFGIKLLDEGLYC